jgi:hypothetical protein
VKTIWGFHTASFRSLFRGLRPRRIEKMAKIFALRDRLQNFAEFSHGLFRGYDKPCFRLIEEPQHAARRLLRRKGSSQ